MTRSTVSRLVVRELTRRAEWIREITEAAEAEVSELCEEELLPSGARETLRTARTKLREAAQGLARIEESTFTPERKASAESMQESVDQELADELAVRRNGSSPPSDAVDPSPSPSEQEVPS